MSTVLAGTSSSVVPERRPREVIDVDLLDDTPQRPARRRRLLSNVSRASSSSEIIVLDSDEEPQASSSVRLGRRVREHPDVRLFSPPPPLPTATIPPVPAIPGRFRTRVNPRPPVVRPNEVPFAFEAALQTPTPPRTQAFTPAAASTSHHRPVMGFGGAILSLHRQNAVQEQIEQERTRQRTRQRYFENLRRVRGIYEAQGFFSSALSRMGRFPTWLFSDPSQDEILDAVADAMNDEGHDADPSLFGDFDNFGAHFRRTQPEYKVAYTHPYPPAPGFTHSFGPPPPPASVPEVIVVDDEPGTSSSSSGPSSSTANDVSISLVCARCLDPLLLGDHASEVDRANKRLWGLRCGHILDGKCINELMKPPPPLELEKDGVEISMGALAAADAKGKGKAKASNDDSHTQPGQQGSTSDPKGKGKATEAPADSDPEFPLPAVDSNSIRSRLRPRNQDGHVLHGDSGSASQPSASSQVSPHRRPQARPAYLHAIINGTSDDIGHSTHSPPRMKAKGKQKVTEPRVEAQHEWRCPVPTCKHMHLSLKVEGKGWVMDEKRGAIGIFA
ncbi:hypothetical protein BV25DRAFT_1158784 [Artomyces pyxidatus]|uniref:Uncharacterized protein n=1 Tax=Artomyces pyxidatus TaxID=48021 RepID=A0ACB8SSZ5_9AGAM|nr:hypothetical protein BV25DRAFT_1158784 [Artomyces pyxidatus]